MILSGRTLFLSTTLFEEPSYLLGDSESCRIIKLLKFIQVLGPAPEFLDVNLEGLSEEDLCPKGIL